MDGRGIKQKQVWRFAKLVAKLSAWMDSAWRCVRDWRGTPEACSGAAAEEWSGSGTPESPTAAYGGNAQMKKNNRSIYAEYWWNYKIIAKYYAKRPGRFGGCAAH